MYFRELPLLYYSLDNSKTKQIVRDITVRAKLADVIKDSVELFEKHIVIDGERPEHIAAKLYGNPELHWIILMINDIIDPYEDWAMSDIDLEKYINENYGPPNDIHHYEDPDGYWVVPNTLNAYPVTRREYYTLQNELKRTVKVIRPDLVQYFVEEFNRLMKQ